MRTRVAISLAALLCTMSGVSAKDRKARAVSDAERNAALARGLDYLERDLFHLPEVEGTPRKPFTFAAAGLAILASPTRTTGGRDPIPRIARYLEGYVAEVARRVQDPDALPAAQGVFSSNRLIQYTWPVAAAGLFFAELDARGRANGEARRAMATVVKILLDAQQGNGGWGHGKVRPVVEKGGAKERSRTPNARDESLEGRLLKQMRSAGGSYPSTLVASSSLVAASLAVLHDRQAGTLAAPLRRASAYLRDAAHGDGSFPYDPSQRSAMATEISVGRTAGAIFAMARLGMAHEREFAAAADYLLDHLDDVPEGHGSPSLNLVFGGFACDAIGPEAFRKIHEALDRRVLDRQTKEGCFRCICRGRGFGVTCENSGFGGSLFQSTTDCYVTALHCLFLAYRPGRLKILSAPSPRPVPATTPSSDRRR